MPWRVLDKAGDDLELGTTEAQLVRDHRCVDAPLLRVVAGDCSWSGPLHQDRVGRPQPSGVRGVVRGEHRAKDLHGVAAVQASAQGRVRFEDDEPAAGTPSDVEDTGGRDLRVGQARQHLYGERRRLVVEAGPVAMQQRAPRLSLDEVGGARDCPSVDAEDAVLAVEVEPPVRDEQTGLRRERGLADGGGRFCGCRRFVAEKPGTLASASLTMLTGNGTCTAATAAASTTATRRPSTSHGRKANHCGPAAVSRIKVPRTMSAATSPTGARHASPDTDVSGDQRGHEAGPGRSGRADGAKAGPA
jgi:hypothetical protein